MKVKYREISEEMRKIAVPNSIDSEQKKQRSSVNTSIDVIEHYNVDVDKLIPYNKQARKHFSEEEIEGLAQSIKEHGIRQPLSIIQSKIDPTLYEVVSGERRLRASKILGLKKVPCIILADHLVAEEIALIENIQRQNLHPIEMGDAFAKILRDRRDLNQQELAKKLGISNKVISECVRFSHLPDDVKLYLIEKNVTGRDLLRKLSKMENPKDFINQFEESALTEIKKTSILRISLVEGHFKPQLSAVNDLSADQKVKLKHLLLSICEKI